MKGFIADQIDGRPVVLTPIRFGLPVVAVAAAAAVAYELQTVIDPSVVLLVGVVAISWMSGLWPAMIAAVLATLALDYFFTPPLYAITPDFRQLPHLLVFMGIAAGFVAISAARRRAEQLLKQAHDTLEAKVRERTVELLAANERLEELAGRLIHAQEQERKRIGRELHDHISQMLGVLTIRLDQLRADDSTPATTADALGDLRQRAAEVTDEIHGLSHRLHSSALDYLGLVPAVQKLVREFSARHDIAIKFTHSGVPAALPSDVALSLFRVIEESLTNMAKHSHAKEARVDVRGRDGGIALTVEDWGRGFDSSALERDAGLGFVSMRERLRMLRGTVRVDSTPGRGTTIAAWAPVPATPPDAGDERHQVTAASESAPS